MRRLTTVAIAVAVATFAAFAVQSSPAPTEAPVDAVAPVGARADAERPAPRRTASAPDSVATPATSPPAVRDAGLNAAVADTVASVSRALALALGDDRVAYAAALRARDSGAYGHAIVMFGRVATRGSVLAPVAHLRLAQVLASDHQLAAAATAFDAALGRADFPQALRVAALFDAADNALTQDRPAEALALLAGIRSEAAAATSDRAEAAFQSANIRFDSGDMLWVNDAIAALTLQPGSATAARALGLLESEGVAASPLAAAYVRYRAFDDAAARAGYEDVATAAGPVDAATAYFYLGALDERAGRTDDALADYARSLARAPFGPLADDARFWRGRIYDDRGSSEQAISEYDALAADFPSSTFAAEAEMRAAILAALAGDGPEALERFRQITVTGTADDAARAARWHEVFRLRVGIATGPALDAAAFDPTALPSLLGLHPMLAAGGTLLLPAGSITEQPRAVAPAPGVPDWLGTTFGPAPTTASGSALSDPRFVLGRELVRVGEPSVGRALMREFLLDLGGRPHDLLAVAQAFGELGLFDLQVSTASRLLRPLTANQLLSAPASVLSLAYPIPYADLLQSSATLGGVPQLLLAALVRQESAWDAEAVSSANAVGLTQVTEPTGRQIAAALDRPWTPEMLLIPSTALDFGAYYLGEQLTHFEGNLAAAIAAYNGGPGSVARWLKAQPIPGVDGFLMAIDYRETQRFVDRVLENYAWYRFVYGAAATPARRKALFGCRRDAPAAA